MAVLTAGFPRCHLNYGWEPLGMGGCSCFLGALTLWFMTLGAFCCMFAYDCVLHPAICYMHMHVFLFLGVQKVAWCALSARSVKQRDPVLLIMA